MWGKKGQFRKALNTRAAPIELAAQYPRSWRPHTTRRYHAKRLLSSSRPRRARLATAATCLLLVVASSPAGAEPDRWWGTDKALHFSACLMFAGDGYATASVLSEQERYRLLAGFGVAFAAGAAKEVYDRSSGGDASWRDLTWDVLGAATGAAISWLIDRYAF
jgi:uncharacterized protein YfiM (DUF2279 family)